MADGKRRGSSGTRTQQKRSGTKQKPHKRGSARKKRMRAKRRKLLIKRAAVGLALIGIVYGIIQLMLFLNVRKYDGDTVLDGVYIEDINVGGMTLEQVEKELEKQMLDYGTGTLELKVSDKKSADAIYSELGVSLDAEKLAQEAMDYGKEGSLFTRWRQIRKCEKNDYVIKIKYSVDKKAATAVLEERCADLFEGPVNATIENKKGEMVVTEGQDGKVLDTKGTLTAITEFLNDNWNGKGGVVTVKSKTVEPEIHAKDLEEIQDLLGSFQTTFSSGASGSVTNIKAGAAHLNGTVVLPGEEFSVNSGMEPYTEEEGYVMAASYANGEVVETMGGGICQVSTTTYNALLFAELEITERYPHSMTITYVEPAMDAAIADDLKDLKFVNNYDTAIYIECITKNDTLTVNIYGKETRPEGRTIAFESEILEQTVPEGARFVATDNYVGYYQTITAARTGYTAKLWKIVYEDGEEVSRDAVNISYYNSAKKVVGVGTNTSDEDLKKKIVNAIATQDEETIKKAVFGGGEEAENEAETATE